MLSAHAYLVFQPIFHRQSRRNPQHCPPGLGTNVYVHHRRSRLVIASQSTLWVHNLTCFLRVSFADARTPQQSATAQVTVTVGYCATQPPPPPATFPPPTMAPNEPPYFTVSTYTFTAVCNSQPGTAIGSVYVRFVLTNRTKVEIFAYLVERAINRSNALFNEVLFSSAGFWRQKCSDVFHTIPNVRAWSKYPFVRFLTRNLNQVNILQSTN